MVAQVLWGIVALRHGAGRAWIRGNREGWRDRSLTAAAQNENEKVLEVLCRDNEEMIRQAPGVFWRLYFLLTGGGAK